MEDANGQDGAAKLAVAPTGKPLLVPAAQFRMVLISFLAAGIGLVAGCIAFLLYKLIGLFTNAFFFHRLSTDFSSARLNHLGIWVIITPVIGGIIVGFMAKYGSSKIKGHGIPEAMEAVLANRSRIEPKVAILKPISAAIAIGTGGPFGAEGPIIQTGGAIGSLVGQVLHTTASERKVLLACGAAAGMSATFNTPIAGVILAIELLLFEFKSRSFIPLVIASTLATAVHVQLLGPGPMFTVAPVDFGIPRALPFYLVLGLLCGLAAVGFSKLLYWVKTSSTNCPWTNSGGLRLEPLGWGLWVFCAARAGSWIRHDQRHPECKPGAEASADCDDCESGRAGRLPWLGNIRRPSRSHVHVERGLRRVLCDINQSPGSIRTACSWSVRTGRHGRGFRRCLPRDFHFYYFRL